MQNSVCLGSSLSMRSFTIEESNSLIPARLATLVVCISKRFIFFMFDSERIFTQTIWPLIFYPNFMPIYWEKTMTRQGYLVFHPLSSVKECQVRTNMLSFIILTLTILFILAILTVLITLNLLSSTPHPHPYAKYERVSVWDKHVVACHWPKEIMSWCPAT